MTLSDIDKINIIIMRGLGYHQIEIAYHVNVSVVTINKYLILINEQAKKCENDGEMYSFFWEKLLGNGFISFIRSLLKSLVKKEEL